MAFNSERVKAAALVVLIFLLGVAFGAVGVLAGRQVFGAGSRSKNAEQGQLTQLMGQLNLTPDQQQQFQKTLAETRERYEQLRREMEPQLQNIREKSRDRIRQILTAEQKTEFEKYLRERRNVRLLENGRRDGQGNLGSRNGRSSALASLTEELHLNAEQQNQLSAILSDTRAEMDALRQQMNPLFEEARLQNRERLRQIVNPEQRQILDNFFQRRDEQRREQERRRQ